MVGLPQEEIAPQNNNIIFGAHPEIKPEYKGGFLKLLDDINSNLEYPKRGCIEGRVFLSFIIDTLGQVTKIQITRGLNKKCDKEAIRVVKLLNNWIPGTQRGKKVSFKYTIPIRFKLN